MAKLRCTHDDQTGTGNDEMSPDVIKQLRQRLGYSHSEVAHLLGLAGENAKDRAREMEHSSGRPPTAPMLRLLEYVAQAFPELEGQGDDPVLGALPQFMRCEDLAGERTGEVIMHTRWPRFYAIAGAKLPSSIKALAEREPERVVHLDDGTGIWMAVAFIDQPVHDPRPFLLETAARLSRAKVRGNQ